MIDGRLEELAEVMAADWHLVSDHEADGTPLGGPLCNCQHVAERAINLGWWPTEWSGIPDYVAAKRGPERGEAEPTSWRVPTVPEVLAMAMQADAAAEYFATTRRLFGHDARFMRLVDQAERDHQARTDADHA